MSVKTPLLMIGTPDGHPFIVRLLPEGARVSRGGTLVEPPHTLVEFYDAAWADDGEGHGVAGSGRVGGGFGPLGQFVADYRLVELMRGHDPVEHSPTVLPPDPVLPGVDVTGWPTMPGLDLYGGVDAWTLTGPQMTEVMLWIGRVAPDSTAQARRLRDATYR